MTVIEADKKNTKWIWIALGGSVLFCLCAVGVAALVIMRMGQQFKAGMKTDPRGAAEAAHAIIDYELPDGYQEQAAMDFFTYSMVVITHTSTGSPSSYGKPMMLLTEFHVPTNRAQMEEQVRRSFERQMGPRGVAMRIVESRKVTIRGEEVEVITYEGTDENGFVIRELITSFPGKGGAAMLMLIGNAQYWDKEEIDAFVESIH